MAFDISGILKDWPYQSGQVTARRIQGDDGREKIQLRLDLGLYQMETKGRPDGQRPYDMESLLDYHQELLRRHVEAGGGDDGFELDSAACEALRAEGMMYYHRYLAQFVLEDYASVERDTARNLKLMDFCTRYASEENDRMALEQYRPYVIMMHARAVALMAFKRGSALEAISGIQEAATDIRAHYHRFGAEKAAGNSAELAILHAMAREIQSQLPADPLKKLRRDLSQAVLEERYEDAALLRDRLKHLAADEGRGRDEE